MLWVESSGGPLALIAAEALPMWAGASGHDYEQACEVDGFDVIAFGADKRALILWEEPARTTFLAGPMMFAQWLYADPGTNVDRVLADTSRVEWEAGPLLDINGPMILLDAAAPGADLQIDQSRGTMSAEAISLDIPPGHYRVEAGETNPSDRTCFRLYRLVLVR
ncbi:immunity 21 family protein [Nonomuraea sp. 3-1Str]|uniref:Imm21 family immunity protein n=1 Tax=Nonomuraea sp. 3-1Str TaxID=2929801 RepID=UPI002861B8A1|nr:Imm21 family immunity protein [Nonomuraea sp. 3-1Str]MDR8410821.1 immunity 21 family protein [Nonomuraea sp. 3-1Str]